MADRCQRRVKRCGREGLNRQDEVLKERIGWGGRIRTFTVLINSEVSYQLDHAPAGDCMAAPGRAGACRPSLQSDEEHKKHSTGRAISKSGIG
jgi:hypothetical protein